jgi:hypothetical protein
MIVELLWVDNQVLNEKCPKRTSSLDKRRKSKEKRVIQAGQNLFSLASFLFCPVIKKRTPGLLYPKPF